MKKLFKMIRQGNLDEVKAIIEKKPEAVNCIAASPPKKDNGQSPLQVAIKIGECEIANYLIDMGADINFMEAEDDDPGVRAPVLYDAVRSTLECLCYGLKNVETSQKEFAIAEKLLELGADANKVASNDLTAWDVAVHQLETIIECDIYSDVHDIAKEQADKIFKLLEKYGFDKNAWLDRHFFDESNRELYVDDFVPKPDKVQTVVFRGKEEKTVIKGDVDRTAKIREFMKNYF